MRLRTQGVAAIHVLTGEYEGYGAQAKNLGMEVIEHDFDEVSQAPEWIEPGYWFISNPSARQGNILPDHLIKGLLDAGHQVILDLAYVGLTREHVFDVSHPNIAAVVISFSKPYGVFRLRLGGFIFTRKSCRPFMAVNGLKTVSVFYKLWLWQKQLVPITSTLAISPCKTPLLLLNAKFDLGLVASDVLLLAELKGEDAALLSSEKRAMIAPFRRGEDYRFCLTPYFEQAEAQGFVPEFYARTQGSNFAVQSVDESGDKCKEEDFPCRVWLRQHYDELPVNEWVAVNLDGLVDHDPRPVEASRQSDCSRPARSCAHLHIYCTYRTESNLVDCGSVELLSLVTLVFLFNF